MEEVQLPTYVNSVLAIIGGILSGYLLKTGLVTADQLPMLGSAAVAIIVIIWRLIAKRTQRDALKAAIAAPAGKAT